MAREESGGTGKLVLADKDGAVITPRAELGHVLGHAPEQERMDGRIMTEVSRRVPLPGLYPVNEHTKARYAADKD